jgi:hypothetical protein
MDEVLTACRDDSFGPGVQSSSCRGGFDFTGIEIETFNDRVCADKCEQLRLKKAFYQFSLRLASSYSPLCERLVF